MYYVQNNALRSHHCKWNHTWLFSCDSLEKEYVLFHHLWRGEARVLSQQADLNTVWQHWQQTSLYSFPNYHLQNKLLKGLSILRTLQKQKGRFFYQFCLTQEFLVILNMCKTCNICTVILTVSVPFQQSLILLLRNDTQDKIRLFHFIAVRIHEFTEHYFVK